MQISRLNVVSGSAPAQDVLEILSISQRLNKYRMSPGRIREKSSGDGKRGRNTHILRYAGTG